MYSDGGETDRTDVVDYTRTNGGKQPFRVCAMLAAFQRRTVREASWAFIVASAVLHETGWTGLQGADITLPPEARHRRKRPIL